MGKTAVAGSATPVTAADELTPATALLAIDGRWSNALFRAGGGVPRPVWKLFELTGDGLVWLALALGCALAPAAPPPLRAAWANFLAAWVSRAWPLCMPGVQAGAGPGCCSLRLLSRRAQFSRLQMLACSAQACRALPQTLGVLLQRTCPSFLQAVDLALVGLLKGTVRRARPVYNLRSDFAVVVAVDHFSFPSGHSSRCERGQRPGSAGRMTAL